MFVTPIHKAIYRITAPYEGGSVVFLYLLKGDRVALVDTGTASCPELVLKPALAEIGMVLSDVEIILNSHGHLDHAGGNLGVKQASSAPAYLHSGDLQIAQSLESELEYHIAPMRALQFPEEFIQHRVAYYTRTAGTIKADVSGVLSDGDIVDLGKGVVLNVLHTPGHTPGSVCFYWESEGAALTADAIQGLGPKIGSYPYYSDPAAYRTSLEILLGLKLRLLCMGHAAAGGGVINDPTRREADCRALIEDSMRTSDTIHRAVVDALREKPGASKREIALLALSELIYSIPQLLVRETGMPWLAGVTLVGHIEAALAGTYPG